MAKTIKGFDFSKKEIEFALKEGTLLQVSINISRKCNYRCLYCLMDGGEPREDELSNDEIKRVLSEAKDAGAKTWYIAGDGEPLLHKGIEDLVDYANNDLGMWVVLATNGELLTEEKANELNQKDISIITKFNAFDQEVFNYLVQRKTTFERVNDVYVPRGVASLIKAGYNKEEQTRAGIETVITTKNIDDIPDVYKFALNHNLYTNIEMILPIGRAAKHPVLIPSEEQIRELYSELDKIKRNGGDSSTKMDISHYEGIDCYSRLKYSLYTNSRGDAFLCFNQVPELSTRMNVRNFSLKDIVAKRKYPKFFGGCACMYYANNLSLKNEV